MTQRLVGLGALLGSLLAHAALILNGTGPLAPRSTPLPSVVELAIMTPPVPEPKPLREPEPEPAPDPKRRPAALSPRPVPTMAEPARSEPPAPADPPPPELTGTTLASALAEGWSVSPGNGAARSGPIQGASAGALPTTQPKPMARAAALAAVPLAELSRKPVPPSLEGALERNYPADARRQGRSGEARVRARIEPNGTISRASVSSESSPGFGAACQKTLLASRWTAPLDAAGHAAATFVTYRCKFRIDR
jgi:periplasmic protein TonB